MNQEKIIKSFDSFTANIENVVATLGKRTIFSLCVSFFIIFVSIMLIDNWIGLFNAQTNQLIKSRKIQNDLYDLKYHIATAESAQRGFLITGRDLYLTPFDQAIKKANHNMRAIEQGFSANFEKSQHKDNLLEKAKAYLVALVFEMQATIKLAKSGDNASAVNLINTDGSFQHMFEFNQTVDHLIKNQLASINEKVNIRNDNAFYARCLVIISSLIWLTLVVLVIKQMMKEMTSKEKLKITLRDEIALCEKKLSDQNLLVRTLALDYQQDVERERRQLSSELHDELGALFTATKMDISWLIKKLKGPLAQLSPSMMIEKLEKTTQYINAGISYHRQVIQQLNPAGLSTLGIWPTLQTLITDAAERNNWKLTLDLPEASTPIDETIGLVTYRLVQETLNNANKYAKANAISVMIMLDEHYLKLEIEDNGIGIDLTAQKSGSYGIAGMQNRIVAIGGKFEIISELGKGVLTRALIPLKVTGV